MPEFYDAETAFSDLFTDMSTYEDLLTPEHVDPVSPEEIIEVTDEFDATYNEFVTSAIRLNEIDALLQAAIYEEDTAYQAYLEATVELNELEYRLAAQECACEYCQDERWELQ